MDSAPPAWLIRPSKVSRIMRAQVLRPSTLGSRVRPAVTRLWKVGLEAFGLRFLGLVSSQLVYPLVTRRHLYLPLPPINALISI